MKTGRLRPLRLLRVISSLIALLPALAQAAEKAPLARLYLAYAYEWNHYRCSENVPGDMVRLIRSHTPLTTAMSLQRLDLGVTNLSSTVLRETRLTIDLPPSVVASPHAQARWVADPAMKGRWSALVGDLGAGLMRLASPTGPLLLEVKGAIAVPVRYTMSTTNHGALADMFSVQRTRPRGVDAGC